MDRTLHSHKVNPINDVIDVGPMDEPGPGGANHSYRIDFPDEGGNTVSSWIHFQKGPITEAGINGITHEVLLAIIEDRLEAFQKGPYSCRENAIALTKIQEAQHWLHHRTRARIARGVEGTSKL